MNHHLLDLCACGHIFSVHRDFGGCLAAMALTRDHGLQNMSPDAQGSPRTPQSSVCPCDAFHATGERWEAPDENDPES